MIKGLTSSFGYLRNLFAKTPKENAIKDQPVEPEVKFENPNDWEDVAGKRDLITEKDPSLKKQD